MAINYTFFNSNLFNSTQNTARQTKDDIGVMEKSPILEISNIKLVPLGEWIYSTTINKEYDENETTIVYNQVRAVNSITGKTQYYDVITTEEKANVVIYALRLRTIDFAYAELMDGKTFNVYRHSFAKTLGPQRCPAQYYDSWANDNFYPTEYSASKIPLIRVELVTKQDASGQTERYKALVITDAHTGADYSKLSLTRMYVTYLVGSLDTATGDITYGNNSLTTINGNSYMSPKSLVDFIGSLSSNNVILSSTFTPIYGYKKTGDIVVIENYSIYDEISYPTNQNEWYLTDEKYGGYGILLKSGREYEQSLKSFFPTNVANITNSQLNIELFGQAATIINENTDANDLTINHKLVFSTNSLPQGCFFSVNYKYENISTGTTETRPLINTQLGSGLIYDTSQLELYQQNNANAYALAVKFPNQFLEDNNNISITSNVAKFWAPIASQAITGAVVGSVVPGLGTATGAAFGTVSGTITSAINLFVDSQKASDTAKLQKTKNEEIFAAQMDNLKKSAQVISNSSTPFLVFLTNIKLVSKFTAYAPSVQTQKVLDDFYGRYGYVLNSRIALLQSVKDTFNIQTIRSLFDMDQKGDKRIQDICRQLDDGVIFIGNQGTPPPPVPELTDFDISIEDSNNFGLDIVVGGWLLNADGTGSLKIDVATATYTGADLTHYYLVKKGEASRYVFDSSIVDKFPDHSYYNLIDFDTGTILGSVSLNVDKAERTFAFTVINKVNFTQGKKYSLAFDRVD